MLFILTLLLVFGLVRYILPVVLRAVLGSFVRQQVHKAQQQGFGGFGAPPGYGSGPGSQQQPNTPPGQVHIDYVPPTAQQARQSEFKGGEYVEYEDVS